MEKNNILHTLKYIDKQKLPKQKNSIDKVNKLFLKIEKKYKITLTEFVKDFYKQYDKLIIDQLIIYELKYVYKKNVVAEHNNSEITLTMLDILEQTIIDVLEPTRLLNESTLTTSQITEILDSADPKSSYNKYLSQVSDIHKLANSNEILELAIKKNDFSFASFLIEQGNECNFTDEFAEISHILKNTDDLNFRQSLHLINELLERDCDLNKLIYNEENIKYRVPQINDILNMKSSPLLNNFKKHFLLQMLTYQPDIDKQNEYNNMTIRKIIETFSKANDPNLDYKHALDLKYSLNIDPHKTSIQNFYLNNEEFNKFPEILINSIYDPTAHSLLQIALINSNFKLANHLLKNGAHMRFDLIYDTELSIIGEAITDDTLIEALTTIDLLILNGLDLKYEYTIKPTYLQFAQYLHENKNINLENKKVVVNHLINYDETLAKYMTRALYL